jgi:hypothetical protein
MKDECKRMKVRWRISVADVERALSGDDGICLSSRLRCDVDVVVTGGVQTDRVG